MRHRAARIMLTRSAAPVAEIAARLGYAEPSAFHRAFLKWTGSSPPRSAPLTRLRLSVPAENPQHHLVAQDEFLHLAGHRHRKFIDEFDIARHLVMGDLALQKARAVPRPSGWRRGP